MIICIPTETDNIWNIEIEGSHCSPNTINVISLAENHRNAESGMPMKANKRIIFSYDVANKFKLC